MTGCQNCSKGAQEEHHCKDCQNCKGNPDHEWCKHWRQFVHIRGTNRACDDFTPKTTNQENKTMKQNHNDQPEQSADPQTINGGAA